jgi:hypothetical protein
VLLALVPHPLPLKGLGMAHPQPCHLQQLLPQGWRAVALCLLLRLHRAVLLLLLLMVVLLVLVVVLLLLTLVLPVLLVMVFLQ